MRIKKIWALAALTVSGIAPSSFGQVLYYNVSWSGGGASASARVAIDTGVGSPAFATDGLTHVISSGFGSTWIQFNDFTVTAGSTSITPTQDDLTSLTWQSGSPINPTQFFFDADDLAPFLGGVAWSITGSTANSLQLIINPGASQTTYNMTQQSFSAVPEPEEWAAIASSGLLAFALWHRRSRKAAKA